MTDRTENPEAHGDDPRLRRLDDADPADAPKVAEDLADRLARELDGTTGSGSPDSGNRS